MNDWFDTTSLSNIVAGELIGEWLLLHVSECTFVIYEEQKLARFATARSRQGTGPLSTVTIAFDEAGVLTVTPMRARDNVDPST
jgi:hypothetical protein